MSDEIIWDTGRDPAKVSSKPELTEDDVQWDTVAPGGKQAGPRDTSAKGLLLETLKGGGRGALGMARATAKGMMPTEGMTINGQSMALEPKPDLQRLNKQADEVLSVAPDASLPEFFAGKAGEFGGGALFAGAGAGANPTLARGLLLPNSFRPPNMTPPSMFGPLAGAAGQHAAGNVMATMGVPHPRLIASVLARLMRRPQVPSGPSVPLPREAMLSDETMRILGSGALGSLFADEEAQ